MKVNMAKFILFRLTDERIEELKREKVKTDVELKAGDFWECRLFASTGSTKHPRFVKVGDNTANLMRHCKTHHEHVLTGIERLIAELPRGEAEVTIPEFIAKQRAPIGSLARLWGRQADSQQLSRECRLLLWFLDAQIPFNNIDHDLFHAFLRSVNVQKSEFGSAKTVVGSLLPAIYGYVITEILEFLKGCPAVINSYDAWTRGGEKFFSQNYHAINPITFEYRAHLLDLIPYFGPQFAEAVAAALSERRQHWLGGFDILLASGIADAEAKGQCAGALMFGEDDMLKCQNHRLKKVYEVAESESGQFQKDLLAFAALASAAAMKGPTWSTLWRNQRLHSLPELATILYNDTRWEGRYLLLSRAIELQSAIVGNDDLLALDVVQEQLRSVPDYLSEDYFARLRAYIPLLSDLNDVSKLYQTQKFPTGCFVVLLSRWVELRAASRNAAMEPAYLSCFKSAFQRAIREFLVDPVISGPNLFLKAALMHPGVARATMSFVPKAIVLSTFDAIALEAAQLDDGLKDEDAGSAQDMDEDEDWDADSARFFSMALSVYRNKIVGKSVDLDPNFDWSQLRQDGTFDGFSHLGFWASVAQRTAQESNRINPLLPVASMLLSVPAGEAIDEFTFSSTKRTLSQERNSLLGVTVEMITVVRMFIRTGGIHPDKLFEWIERAKEEGKKAAAQARASK